MYCRRPDPVVFKAKKAERCAASAVSGYIEPIGVWPDHDGGAAPARTTLLDAVPRAKFGDGDGATALGSADLPFARPVQ